MGFGPLREICAAQRWGSLAIAYAHSYRLVVFSSLLKGASRLFPRKFHGLNFRGKCIGSKFFSTLLHQLQLLAHVQITSPELAIKPSHCVINSSYEAFE